MAMTVGFLDEVGKAGRAPLCSWRARLAATMINRLVLCSGSSGIEQWALFLTVFSGIGKSLTRYYSNVARIGWIRGSIRTRRIRSARTMAASDSAEDCK